MRSGEAWDRDYGAIYEIHKKGRNVMVNMRELQKLSPIAVKMANACPLWISRGEKALNTTINLVLFMTAKVTSLKIDPELWKKAKMLALKRGATLKSLIEELLSNEVKADEFLGEGKSGASEELLEALKKRREGGLLPFIISSRKSAVELVKEGRGR